MGVLFIAAGSSSKNREKSLEKEHTFREISQFLSPVDAENLKRFFPDEKGIYIWGANPKNLKDLEQVKTGEYAVDVKNKKVIQVFQYCFFVETLHTRLQDFIGWDKEKSHAERRPYKYVYFLMNPTNTFRQKKEFFQTAFNLESNRHWLVGQRYFDDGELSSALRRTASDSIQSFLGINSSGNSPVVIEPSPKPAKPFAILRKKNPSLTVKKNIDTPSWLKTHVEKIKALKKDQGHLERDHEDLVASFFELLGYERIHDIKFRRGNIDIRIEKNNKPLITIEVKADWNLSPESRSALTQAFNYANETGTPYVIITNGDRYCIYDKRQGLSYDEKLILDICLTSASENNANSLLRLKKDNIK
jgi:hypothetical protein